MSMNMRAQVNNTIKRRAKLRERERGNTCLILDEDDFMQTRRTSLGDAVDETFPLRGILQILRAATGAAAV